MYQLIQKIIKNGQDYVQKVQKYIHYSREISCTLLKSDFHIQYYYENVSKTTN